jgi:PAS domain S-box-containing protein
LERKVTLGFGAAVFILCVIGIVSYKSIQQFITTSGWDDHSRTVLATIAEVSSEATNVESSSRGFVITGDDSYVARYQAAADRVVAKLHELRELTIDNRRQQERIDRLEPLILNKIAVMRNTIDAKRSGGLEAAQHLVKAGDGARAMDELRGVLVEMKLSEDRLLKDRATAEEAGANRTITVISAGSTLAFVLVALAGWMIRRDITARRRAELALRESEEQYRFLADSMPQIIWCAGPDGMLNYYNVRWRDYTGMTIEQSIEGWEPVVHPQDLGACLDRWTRSMRSGEPFEGEFRFRRGSDGAYRWQLCRGLARRDEQGNIIQWVGTCTDIEDHKRIETALREAEERLRLLVEGVQDYAIIMLDPEAALRAGTAERSASKGIRLMKSLASTSPGSIPRRI